MAMNVSQFQPNDNFNMAEFNNMIAQINSGVNNEISTVNSSLQAAISNLQTEINTKTKIQTGSYVGTGTYGKDNPCSLTFDFAPKLVFIASNKAFWGPSTFPSYSEFTFIIDVGVTGFVDDNYSELITFNMSNGGKTMTWYSYRTEAGQMNFSEVQYHYVAIG